MNIINFIKNKINKNNNKNEKPVSFHLPNTPEENFKMELGFYKKELARLEQIKKFKYFLSKQNLILKSDDELKSNVHFLKTVSELEKDLLQEKLKVESEIQKIYEVFKNAKSEKEKEKQVSNLSWSVTFFTRTIDTYSSALQDILLNQLQRQYQQFMKNTFEYISLMENQNDFSKTSKLEKIVENYILFFDKQNKQLEKYLNKKEKKSQLTSIKYKER